MSTSHEPALIRAARPLSSARWVLALLFAGNMLNYYDRALPAVVLEQIKAAFGINDALVGVLASAFVLVAAVAGVPLGRLADRVARTAVAGWGLVVWSVFTALSAIPTFGAFFVARVGVGIGESAYSPATASLIPDLYPAERRSRANALFTLGFPLGTLLAFLTAGGLATAFGTWQAPFLIAAVPGFVVGFLVLRLREPRRGATEPLPLLPDEIPAGTTGTTGTTGSVMRGAWIVSLLKVRSLSGLVIAFAGYNFAAYAIGTFLTTLLERYYGLALVQAALISGVVIGVTGLIGLLIGGPALDYAARRSPGTRNLVSAACLAGAAVFSLIGLTAGRTALTQLVVFSSLGYLLGIVYLAASVPATADVVAPKQRSTAFGLIFAVGYLLGGAGGPIAVGLLSDSIARSTSGLSTAQAAAQGLQGSMAVLVPIGFAVAAVGMLLTVRFAGADRATMLSRMEATR